MLTSLSWMFCSTANWREITFRGEYGIWSAFLALLVRLFFSFPGWFLYHVYGLNLKSWKLTTLSFASVFCMLLDSIMYFVCCWIALSSQYSLGKQAIKLYPIFSWFYFKVKISAHFWVGSKRICPTFVCLQPLVSLTF